MSESGDRLFARRLQLRGRVQGLGVRPAIARLASELTVHGHVANSDNGVDIHIEGGQPQLDAFAARLPSSLPSAAAASSITNVPIAPAGRLGFEIRESNPRAAPGLRLDTQIPRDRVVCKACTNEVVDPDDRRCGYVFTSCTDCGPRYSILQTMPYERSQTAMGRFEMCAQCRSEYEDPADRRFHAQTNACPNCGPRCVFRMDGQTHATGDSAIAAAAKAIREQRVVAVLGLGGYQLVVDATSQSAVETLRRRKRRLAKPFAVMVNSIESARRLAELNSDDEALLCSAAGPIVLAQARQNPLALSVQAGLRTIGVMLPTTPLHRLLLDQLGVPIVCTSGNREGEPIEWQPVSAHKNLDGIADAWLEHDREVERPIDDSVVRVMAGRTTVLRSARGLGPLALPIESKNLRPWIAVGGHIKSAFALCNGLQAVLGPHVGELSTISARERYAAQLQSIRSLYGVDNPAWVCDRHPDYFTTRLAEERSHAPTYVQHHHAHVMAAALEHGWLDRDVFGLAWDGSGLGDDGAIWGGECLIANAAGYRRTTHLRPFHLPGGELAIRHPWRVAISLLHEALGEQEVERFVKRDSLFESVGPLDPIFRVLQRDNLSPRTTSVGRLFDGVAAIALSQADCLYEGQLAMLLESICDPNEMGEYELPWSDGRERQLDWRGLIIAVAEDRRCGVAPGSIAMKFHRTLASAVYRLGLRHKSLPTILSGGVFQNRVLVELIHDRFTDDNLPIGLPGAIPPNDGGLAAGQLVIAMNSLEK